MYMKLQGTVGKNFTNLANKLKQLALYVGVGEAVLLKLTITHSSTLSGYVNGEELDTADFSTF